jgi:hypothetical protein
MKDPWGIFSAGVILGFIYGWLIGWLTRARREIK